MKPIAISELKPSIGMERSLWGVRDHPSVGNNAFIHASTSSAMGTAKKQKNVGSRQAQRKSRKRFNEHLSQIFCKPDKR
jgi:hypothetical protein